MLLGGFLGPLPRHEGVNHTYSMNGCALWRLQLAGRGPSFRAESLHVLCAIVSSGGLITSILRMIGICAVAARSWGALIIRILRMIVHLGVFMLKLGGF